MDREQLAQLLMSNIDIDNFKVFPINKKFSGQNKKRDFNFSLEQSASLVPATTEIRLLNHLSSLLLGFDAV